MPKSLLTDTAVRSLASPQKGQITYWDVKLPGFGCRVSQGGQKTFVVMYGPREARRRKVVGKYPLHSLKLARDEARKVLAGVALGIVDTGSASLSFSEARDRFLDAARRRNKPRTAADYKRLLTRHFNFNKKRLAEIERSDLQQSLAKLSHAPSEQLHAYTAIRIFFNWAYREELIERNPADRLQRAAHIVPRERVLDERELREVLTKAQLHPWPFGAIVTLCILTGQRRSEIGMLRWDWIDFEEQTITLPGEKIKNGRTHTFPFGDMTVGVLGEIPRVDDYLFPGRNESNAIFNGWSKSKRNFDDTLQNVKPYTLHDLRRTFSTMHARLGTPIHVTERLINHISGAISGVAAIYNRHSYLPEMRTAVERYENHLTDLSGSWSALGSIGIQDSR